MGVHDPAQCVLILLELCIRHLLFIVLTDAPRSIGEGPWEEVGVGGDYGLGGHGQASMPSSAQWLALLMARTQEFWFLHKISPSSHKPSF